MAYATAADLATYMQQPDLDIPSAELVLELVSEEIDSLIGQSLAVQTHTELLLDGPVPGSSTLVIPGYPVTALTAVSVMDRLGEWTALVGQQDYLWSEKGIVTRISSAYQPDSPVAPRWPRYPQSIKVSYTRGLADPPAGIRAVCLAAAARTVSNPGSILSEQIGSVSVSHGDTGRIGFAPMEEAVISRWRDVVTA